MTSWTYLVQSVPWAIAGLIVGWLMGRSTVAVESIAEAVHEEGATVAEHIDLPPQRRVRFTSNVVIGLVLLVLGSFTIVQTYVQNAASERQARETERLATCTKAYADGFADAIEERSASVAAAQQALDDFLTAVSSATPTQEGRDLVRRALEEYLDKRADAKRSQQEHPYPDPPRDACD